MFYLGHYNYCGGVLCGGGLCGEFFCSVGVGLGCLVFVLMESQAFPQ